MLQALPFRADHPLSLGMFERGNADQQSRLKDSDVVVVLGGRTVYRRVSGSWLDHGRIIQISPISSDIGKSHNIELGIVADIPCTVRLLTARMPRQASRGFAYDLSDNHPVMPSSKELTAELAASVIGKALPRGTILVDDSQSFGYFLRRQIDFGRIRHVFGSLASHLGWGIPAGCGVQIALDSPTVCIVSDGSWALSFQAVWTAARHELAMLIIVIANNGFASLRNELVALDIPESDAQSITQLTTMAARMDVVGLARSLGAHALEVRDIPALAGAIETWAANPCLTVMEVCLPSDVSTWQPTWLIPPTSTL
jgi:benzoylformate decarboxylase